MALEPRDEHFRRRVHLFLRFLDAEPWHRLSSEGFFGLAVPGEPHPMLASILGSAGQEFGIGLHRGPQVIDDVAAMMREGPRGRAALRGSVISAMSILLRELDPARRSRLRKIGVRQDPGAFFVAKPSGERARDLSETEESILEWSMTGVLLALERSTFEARPLESSGELDLIRAGGSLEAPEIQVVAWPYEVAEHSSRPRARADLDLSSVPLLAQSWIVSVETLPAAVKGDPRPLHALLLLEPARERIIALQILESDSRLDAARCFADACAGHNAVRQIGRPRELVCADEELCRVLEETCELQGMVCGYERDPAYLLEVRASMDRELGRKR